MHLLHLLARFQETARHRVAQQLLAHGLELPDFFVLQLQPLALLHLQQAAEIVDLLVMKLEPLIGHEGVDTEIVPAAGERIVAITCHPA